MLCSHCGKREANFHYRQVNNGHSTEAHLCTECAKELGYMNKAEQNFGSFGSLSAFPSFGMDFADMFKELLGFPSAIGGGARRKITCDSCGTAYDDFVNSGLLGCEDCYDEFAQDIENILTKIQPSTVHKGKGKAKTDDKKQSANSAPSELDTLKTDLKKAVDEERYEDAAKIRDRIKTIEDKDGGRSDG